MKRLLPIVFVFCTIFPAIAQKRAMNWYFGKNAGLSFSVNGTATALSNGVQDAFEACATISDINGNLLFYTDGNNVYTSSHNLMSNGSNILGNKSATQGALIIPQPGAKNIYYLFTLNDTTNNQFNINYSIIDMSLNNEAGAVTSTKNVLLYSGVSERIAATYNQNGSGVWIMVRDGDAAEFHAFLLSSTGISSSPVTTSVGTSTSSSFGVQAGQMKFSPDGAYLAWSCRTERFVELLKFNKVDGTLDSWSRKINFSGTSYPYGVEFSSDISYFYVSCAQNGIFQYDMEYIVNESLFQGSEEAITSSSNYFAYALQLAPNGKIYCAAFWAGVHVINAPNKSHDQVDFQTNAHTYPFGKNCRDGLPSFLSNYFVDKKIVSSDTCFGDSTSFAYLLELGDSVLWDFGDIGSSNNTSTLTAPKHVYTKSGKFDVKLILFNGDGADTVKTSVKINALPVFDLGNDTTVCFGAQYLLNPGLSNAYYLWQDGNTTPVYSIKQSGTYSVRIERMGCIARDTVAVTVDKPIVSIISNTASSCENKNAFNFTLAQIDRVSSVLWNFGDGFTSSGRQTTHSYALAGAYEVNLETINENGCKARATENIEVLPVVPASIQVNSAEQCFDKHSFEVSFPDRANGELKMYFFEFSDGKRSINSGSTFTFPKEGANKVSLVTISNDGCKDTAIQELFLYPSPQLKYTIDSSANCFADNVVLLNDKSVSPNGSIASKVYSSSGMTFTGNQAAFKYTAPGLYAINATVTDIKGCDATQTIQVNIHPNPEVEFELSGGKCIGTKPIQLINNTIIASGTVDSYSWDFGDGNFSTAKEPIQQYADAKLYSIKLTAVSNKGCEATYSKEVVTFEAPEANMIASSFEPCLNESHLDLFNDSKGGNNDALSYEWYIEGTTYTTEDVLGIQFNSPGPKLVRLRVTSDKGCYDEMQTTFMVMPSPEVTMFIDEPAQCEEANLFTAMNTSVNPLSSIASEQWILSDGREFKGNEVNFTMPDFGVYDLTLKLVNRAGCAAELSNQIQVYPQPNASFEAKDVCQSTPMVFTNLSTVAEGSVVQSWWDFGDQVTSEVMNPVHQYASAGEYAVYLQIKSDKGCENFIVGKVKVHEEPHTAYTYKKHQYKQGVNETVYRFESEEENSSAIIHWYLDGKHKVTGRIAFIGFSDTGHHEVTIIVETGAGCPGTSSKEIFVAPPFELFMPTGFTPNGDGKNDILRPVGDNYINEFEMVVVNRWGTVMYKTTSIEEGWDGRFQGDLAQPGAYVYLIRVVDIEGVEWKYEGTVVLLQ